MTSVDLILQEEAYHLAQQLFGNDSEQCANFTDRLLDIYARAQGKDFLLIHNPGGWGDTRIERCLQWERSIVNGVSATIGQLDYNWLLIQHFRNYGGWLGHVRDCEEIYGFFSFKARELAAELKFLVSHINSIKIILIGISQGAAFNNAVMQHLDGLDRVYSIELGMFFLRRSWRVITERTLEIEGNGLMPDAMMEWKLAPMLKAFCGAPFRWIKYQLQRKPMKFSHCINTPGHEYNWEYPEVRRQIEDFLSLKFGTKGSLGGEVS